MGLQLAIGTDLVDFLDQALKQKAVWLNLPETGHTQLLTDLAATCGALGIESPTARGVVAWVLSHARADAEATCDLGLGLALVCGLFQGFDQSGVATEGAQVISQLAELFRAAEVRLDDERANSESRALALRVLLRERGPDVERHLQSAISARMPEALQRAAAEAAIASNRVALFTRILANRLGTSTAIRRQLLAGSTRTPELSKALLDALEAGVVDASEVDAFVRQSLRSARDGSTRERAERLLASRLGDRSEVLRNYEQALTLQGDLPRGRKLFGEKCATCHQLQGVGHRVGPDLAGAAGRPRRELLTSLLDPNRDVSPDSINFVAIMRDGRVFEGLIAGETSASVRLRRAEGAEEALARDQIEELRATGVSLMPEGFEQTLSIQDVADLLALLRGEQP